MNMYYTKNEYIIYQKPIYIRFRFINGSQVHNDVEPRWCCGHWAMAKPITERLIRLGYWAYWYTVHGVYWVNPILRTMYPAVIGPNSIIEIKSIYKKKCSIPYNLWQIISWIRVYRAL